MTVVGRIEARREERRRVDASNASHWQITEGLQGSGMRLRRRHLTRSREVDQQTVMITFKVEDRKGKAQRVQSIPSLFSNR